MASRIIDVECFCLNLPYRKVVNFRGVRNQQAGEYVILRLTLDDGLEGIAESNARADQNGEDAWTLAHRIETFFKPRLIGCDPLEHQSILVALNKTKHCRTEKMLVDMALWDLKGKVLDQPVWRLLGGSGEKPIPLTWLVHGEDRETMVDEAARMVKERGFRGLKLKVWRRSEEDLRMVREIRDRVGPDLPIYCDANGAYSETEARSIISRLSEYGVLFIEEPCDFIDIRRAADMARILKPSLLGDQTCESLAEVAENLVARSVGAVSVKLRRTGFTESLKIVALCEAFGVPNVIGTDSESRIGSQARFHFRAGCSALASCPIETHFFEKLADDAFKGEFHVNDGLALPGEAPGFGASLDLEKLRAYAIPGVGSPPPSPR